MGGASFVFKSFIESKTRVFIVGALCGAAVTAVGETGYVWWRAAHPTRSAEDNLLYDRCLVLQHGNAVACDAMLRLIEHERAVAEHERAVAALKELTAKFLAAGFSKREVVEWAQGQGFTANDVSDAVGISLQDYQQGNY
jgi:hypothetical protein